MVEYPGLVGAAWAGLTVAVLITPICGMLFGCGCEWPGRGLAAACNSFDPTATIHCPWCEHLVVGLGAPLAATLASFTAARRVARTAFLPLGHLRTAILSASAALITALLILLLWGQLTFLWTDYPRP